MTYNPTLSRTEKEIAATQDKVNISTKPDESVGLVMQSMIKIYDPETKEVFIEQRG